MRLSLKLSEVRLFRKSDAESLTRYANNRKVWINLRDLFPHPYHIDDANRVIESSISEDPKIRFAISVEDKAIGAIGFNLHGDVERVSAEIGYWLGEPFWGKGIMTEVVKAVTQYAIEKHQLTRVYALPFEWNKASFRVLEKAGYILEGRMRRSAIKDGKIIDQLLYAYVVDK
jgi:RimJ/RimL family protein N-acetyltransferase